MPRKVQWSDTYEPKRISHRYEQAEAKGEKTPDHLLIGWRSIAAYCAVGYDTARRWERLHGLPVARLPDGRACTSPRLIDSWILARSEAKINNEKA